MLHPGLRTQDSAFETKMIKDTAPCVVTNQTKNCMHVGLRAQDLALEAEMIKANRGTGESWLQNQKPSTDAGLCVVTKQTRHHAAC